jgi:hypothetical protein
VTPSPAERRDVDALAAATTLVGAIAYAAAWVLWHNRIGLPLGANALWTTVLLLGLPLVGLHTLTVAEVVDLGWQSVPGRLAARYVTGGAALSLPVVAALAYSPGWREGLPLASTGAGVDGVFAATLVMLWRAAVLEWFFRGFLLFGLLRKVGSIAVLIQVIPFAMLFWGRPPLVFVAAWPVGLALGFVAWRCQSFLPCVALHGAVLALLQAATWLAVR